MKLKRLLCALVIFTLMMTSVVCSVSAATYQTTTVHNLGNGAGDIGTVSLKTTITGLDEGSMVSYIIYDNDEDAAGYNNGDVAEDGANITYIDQQTADSTGTLVFGEEAKFSGNQLAYQRYKFATSGDEEFTYKTPVNLTNGAEKSGADTLPIGTDVVANNWGIEYRIRYNDTSWSNVKHMSIDSYSDVLGRLQTTSTVFVEDGVKTGTSSTKVVTHPGSTTVISYVPKNGYVFTGLSADTMADTTGGGDSYNVGTRVQLIGQYIGGKIKLDPQTSTLDPTFFQPGNYYQFRTVSVYDYSAVSTAKYIKIDGNPIYGEENGEKSVTFLMTKADTIADTDDYGINLYVFNKQSGIGSLDDAEVVFTGLKSLGEGNKFGIQVVAPVDDDNAKYLDSANYELVAIPYCNGTEFKSTGKTNMYIVDNAELSGRYTN